MPPYPHRIRPYEDKDQRSVVDLWTICSLVRPWNDPAKDIERKKQVQPELFLVLEVLDRIVATAMAGYDGHRGSVYYLAVHPEFQGKGYGRSLMSAVETLLEDMGCPKVNILIRNSNIYVSEFYESLDYVKGDTVLFGKRLIDDDQNPPILEAAAVRSR